ncbi:MAG: CYTH and CHAD domain-containing protein [Mycobacterium sp.]|nr:CYTH and CHAD domain-containing protein [Mycobacterium sp.]
MSVDSPAPERYAEVERKFDVVESTVPPSFEGIAAVGRVETPPDEALDAVYFDTPARDLAANRVTLRRRTGGADAGWHLKLPAGPDARTEVRAPLEAARNGEQDEVPAELRDVVLAIVRDRPLAPVARISTTRGLQMLYDSNGTALAEFCDDQVTAWSNGGADVAGAEQHWREWELELLDPDAAAAGDLLDRLSNRLLEAGAVPAQHGSKLARVLGPVQEDSHDRPTDPVHRAVAEQIDQLVLWDRAVRADADDAVHQMRVAARKIRSLLQTAQELGFTFDDRILDQLRELGAVLGTARDAEVLGDRYRKALDRLPAKLVRGRVRERLLKGAKRRYKSGLRRSLIAMRSQRYFRLLDALESLVAEPVPTADGHVSARATIAASYKRVRKAAKKAAHAGDDERDEALHRIRKRTKRLRYTAAAVGATKVSERAKAIQSLLGDHQDSVVSREHLSHQAEVAHTAGEDAFTFGVLYQQEADLAENCRQQLQPALRKLKKAVRKAQH